MSQPSQKSTPEPMTLTLSVPQPLAKLWRSIEAGRQQSVAVVIAIVWFAMLIAGPWLWGFSQIVADIMSH